MKISSRPLSFLNQFDFVAFRGVNEREGRAAGTRRRAIGKFQAQFGKMLGKFVEAVHLEREMREVGLDLHGIAARENRQISTCSSLPAP